MKTQVTQTSIRAYALADLTNGQRRVIKAMKPRSIYTRRELERVAGMRSGPLCGRVFELIESHLIDVVGEKVCSESGQAGRGFEVGPGAARIGVVMSVIDFPVKAPQREVAPLISAARLKAAWLKRNPDASLDQIDAAHREIVERLGL